MSHPMALNCSRPAALLLAASWLGLSACAALDEAAAGRTDRVFEAPFYVTYEKHTAERPVVVVPVTLDPVSGEPFNPAGRGQALQPLLDALNAALVTEKCCRYVTTHALPARGAPTVYLGMLDGETAPASSGNTTTSTRR